MNDVLLKALLARIEANEMTIEQVPIPLRDGIIKLINGLEE